MARRTVHHTHALHHTETINPTSEHRFEKGYTWCDPKGIKRIEPSDTNNWRGSTGIFTRAEQSEKELLEVNCPECAKRWGKAQLASLAHRVIVEKIENYSGYVKSTYRVTVDGAVRGYISIENGWGEKWRIHRLAHDERSLAGYSHRTNEPVGTTVESNLIHRLHRSSLDGLASLFPQLVDEGKLPTIEESLESERHAREERATREAQRQTEADERAKQRAIDEAARQERRTLAREAVQAVSDRANVLGLSNSETMGLIEALKILS